MKKVLCVLAIAFFTSASLADVVGYDDFTNGDYSSRAMSHNDTYNSNNYDFFGIWDRTDYYPYSVFDDTMPGHDWSYAGDNWGMPGESYGADNSILSFQDNPSAETVEWAFDVTGYGDFFITVDLGACGDFENSGDDLTFELSLDGSNWVTVLKVEADETSSGNYYMENGDAVSGGPVLDDPMEITTGVDAGLELNTNDLYNVTSNTLQGETDTLYVRLSATEFHSYEQMWVDNLQVHGTPEPMTVALLSLGGLFLRRKK